MIYLIYTTLLVAALALVMIFKIVAYMSKEYETKAIQLLARSAYKSDQIDHLKYWERIYQGAEEVKSEITYTDNFSEFMARFDLGIELISDEDKKQQIIKRRVVSMGAYMLKNGLIKVKERSLLGMGYPPDIKYIELTAKVLKPKD